MPPRVFDLLWYLIEHRDRVVSKDELITQVWEDAIVSASVVARAVMKARAAIGDSVDESAQIRTIHRVGYRFVGQPGDTGAALAPSVPAPGTRPARLHLALTPVINATGSPRLAWVELGLLAMIMQPLESDSRLALASVSSVLAVLPDRPAESDDWEQNAVLLASLIGADWVLATSLHRDGADYALRYLLAGRHGVRHAGRLHAAQPIALGALLSARTLDLLFEDDAEPQRERADDAFVDQVVTRGLQAFIGMNMDSAVKLFEVALDMAPADSEVRLKHVQALLEVGADRALPLALGLLADIESEADPKLIAAVHCALAMAYRMIPRSIDTILRHVDESLRRVGRDNSSAWAQRIYLNCIHLLLSRGRRDSAVELFDNTATCFEASTDKLQAIYFKSLRAQLEYADGNLLTARDLWQQTQESLRPTAHSHALIDHCANLADVNAALGDMATALRYCDEGVALQAPGIADDAVRLARFCVRYAEAWRQEALDDALQRGLPLFERMAGPHRSHHWVALAQQAACGGRFAEARAHLERALATAIEYQEIAQARQWAALLVHTMLRAGEFEAAAERAAGLLSCELPDTPELQGLALHARALAQHRLGLVDASRASIRDAVDALAPGRWSALAKLDGAWLDIEAQALDAARQTLSDMHYWLREHPIGQVLQARLLYAQGDYPEAARLQARGLAWGRRRARPHELVLAALYDEAAASGLPQALPRADALPSTA